MSARDCAIHDMRLSETNIITNSIKEIAEFLANTENEIETEIPL